MKDTMRESIMQRSFQIGSSVSNFLKEVCNMYLNFVAVFFKINRLWNNFTWIFNYIVWEKFTKAESITVQPVQCVTTVLQVSAYVILSYVLI